MITFALCVMTSYTFYQCSFQQSYYFKYLFNIFSWLMVYVSSTIIVIYAAEQVTQEVSIGSREWWNKKKMWNQCRKRTNRKSISLQGKATFHVVHEIINYCTEVDITLCVCYPKAFNLLYDHDQSLFASYFIHLEHWIESISISSIWILFFLFKAVPVGPANRAPLSNRILRIVRIQLGLTFQCECYIAWKIIKMFILNQIVPFFR